MKQKFGYVPLVKTVRGGTVESVHYGAICAVSARGKIVLKAGDENTTTFIRSSAKPFQTIALIESGAHKRFGLTDRELAITIGSHNGEDVHKKCVKGILKKIGLSESALKCGTHPPYHVKTRDRLIRRGEKITPLRNNCSGKHAGMLATALHIGASVDDYYSLSHPVQRRILEIFSVFADFPLQKIKIAIDGCGVPTFALPLYNAALAFARLNDPSDLPENLRKATLKTAKVMARYPYMIAGDGRICTALMKVLKQRNLLAKAGAEGFYGLSYVRPVAGFRKKEAVGMVLKISDGDPTSRARNFIVLEALKALSVYKKIPPQLRKRFPAEIITRGGFVAGKLTPAVKL